MPSEVVLDLVSDLTPSGRRSILSQKSRSVTATFPPFSPGFDGVPDRLVFLPGRHFGMVEVKAPGKKPRPLQVSRHRLLQRLGFKVYVIDHPDAIEEVLDEIQST